MSAPLLRSRRRRWAVALGLVVVGIGSTILVQPLWVFDLLARLFPRVVWRVETAAPLVALTFDDGPAPDHPGVIVILHDGIADPSRTLAALDAILSAGKRKGLRFVTVGELLNAASRRPVGHDDRVGRVTD